MKILKKLLLSCSALLALAAYAQDTTDCALTVSYTHTIVGDEIFFTNTSTGEPDAPLYSWGIGGLESTDENPSFSTAGFDDTEEVCLTVYNADWDCSDTICSLIDFTDDDSLVIVDCDSIMISFTHELIGDEISLTSTSTGVPEDATFLWTVNPGFDEALGESATFDTEDYEGLVDFCLTVMVVEDGIEWCRDSLCTTLDFGSDSIDVIDSTDCDLIAGFTYTISGDEIFFTNTSTGEPDAPLYSWGIGGLESTDENPSFSTTGFAATEIMCLTVYNADWDCSDTICSLIDFTDDDSLAIVDCDSIMISFTHELIGDEISLTSTSTGVPEDATFLWTVNPGFDEALGESTIFGTEDYEGLVDFCLTVMVVEDGIEWCRDSLCTTLDFGSDSIDVVDSTDCDLIAGFTYTISGDEIFFTNTSTGEPDAPLYSWGIGGLESTDENPSFSTTGFGATEIVCLTVYNADWDCSDTVCSLITFEEDSIDVIDSTDCELIASFTYTTIGDDVFFTNTSTGEPGMPNYNWWVAGILAGTDEDLTLPAAAFTSGQWVCFEIFDSLATCYDSTCAFVVTDSVDVIDSTDCELIASFTYTTVGDDVFFTNTSTGEPDMANYNWWVSGLLSGTDEDLTLPAAAFTGGQTVCLEIFDSLGTCYDSTCTFVVTDSVDVIDSTDCELVVSFTYSTVGDDVFFTNTSTGEPDMPIYTWWVAGILTETDEDMTLPAADFTSGEWVCLEIFDSLGTCYDSTCTFVVADTALIDSTASLAAYTKSAVVVYPNPVQDQLTIEWSSGEHPAMNIRLYNAVGVLVRNVTVDTETQLTKLQLGDLPKGLYVLEIASMDGQEIKQHQKIIKE